MAASSSDTGGQWSLLLPAGTFRLIAELMGFDRVERSLTLGESNERSDPAVESGECTHTIALSMELTRRQAIPLEATVPPAGRGFIALSLQPTASAGPAADSTPALPPGFSIDEAFDAVAVTGANASVDRGLLDDRAGALRRGEIARVSGELPRQAFGGAGPGPASARGPAGAAEGASGRRSGPRFVRQERLYQATSSVTFAGSMLDAAPFQLHPGTPTTEQDYLRQSADLTLGGPLKIPGIYDGTRRTTLTLGYQASRGDDVFDQYAAVPDAAMRAGDFSSLTTELVDPVTGQPFPGNGVPRARLSPSALALLQYIPLPNVAGTARNFHYTTTAGATQNNVNLRLQHSFAPPAGRGPSGLGGGRAPEVSRAGNAQSATTASVNAQVQYRSSGNDRVSVFPLLGGRQQNASLNVPVTLYISQPRVQHTISLSVARTGTDIANHFAFARDVAGEAGIAGVATDPFGWGVPGLAFSSLSSVNDTSPSMRRDTRLVGSYAWSRWIGKQRLRFGGDLRRDWSTSNADANARGAFVFTGLYSGNDFADFLLGMPQQATVQYGPGPVQLRSRSASLHAEHEWWYSYYTFSSGVRYELTGPYTEASGRLVNLDVAPRFLAATPVASGRTGAYTGRFPEALVRTDINNVMPRLGFAWQPGGGTTLRAGYGVSFNTGSYAGIARQLASQPPFAVSSTRIGTAETPLSMTSAFAVSDPAVANSYGVARNYALGRVQTWNVDLSRDLAWMWGLSGGYTYARGSGLDLVRAPNRGPAGLRIAGAQPFLWQTADGRSSLHSAVLRLRRRTTRGIGGNVTYTLSRSMDDASAIGGGTVVAQDDQNLAAEWGLSSFDRRHQVAGTVNVELPFGPNRRWLNDGGPWARWLEAWTASIAVTVQEGTPLTARVLSAVSDVARGTNGTLRADYLGGAIALEEPTATRFFNTAAFSVPAAGSFGTSSRNIIIGPGTRDVSAQVTRDIPLSGTRALSVQLRVSNLLNLVNYQAVDTVVNSPTFGQVTSVRPLRSAQLNLRLRF